MTVSMEVRSTVSGDDYTASIREQEVTPLFDTWNPSGERWNRKADGSVELRKQLTCTIEKPGGRQTEFQLSLISEEASSDLLNLSEATSEFTGKDWAYIDPRHEEERFYRSLTHRSFWINNLMVHSNSGQEYTMRVRSVRPAILAGDTVSYVTIEFSGELRGAYDPQGDFGTFVVEEGSFRGVIE